MKQYIATCAPHSHAPLSYAPGHDPIWVMTNACGNGIGGVIAQGKDWQTAKVCYDPLSHDTRQTTKQGVTVIGLATQGEHPVSETKQVTLGEHEVDKTRLATLYSRF